MSLNLIAMNPWLPGSRDQEARDWKLRARPLRNSGSRSMRTDRDEVRPKITGPSRP